MIYGLVSDGSGGGTPHSGRPFGRWIRLGSHCSSDSALKRCWELG